MRLRSKLQLDVFQVMLDDNFNLMYFQCVWMRLVFLVSVHRDCIILCCQVSYVPQTHDPQYCGPATNRLASFVIILKIVEKIDSVLVLMKIIENLIHKCNIFVQHMELGNYNISFIIILILIIFY